MKPVVTFTGPARFSHVGDAKVARVYALDHPLLGQTSVITSNVQKHNPDGSFETLNTIYKPITEDYDDPTN
jgi:hypothetical protein